MGGIIKSKCIGNDKYEMLASIYTSNEKDAYRIAAAAGLSARTPYGKPEYDQGFLHYHSSILVSIKTKNGIEKHLPHAFFMNRGL